MAAMDIMTVQPGWDVYGSEGDDIGDVAEVTPQYIRVHKGGGFFKGDLYVPRSAVSYIEGRGVYLNVGKHDVGKQGWDKPPAGSAG